MSQISLEPWLQMVSHRFVWRLNHPLNHDVNSWLISGYEEDGGKPNLWEGKIEKTPWWTDIAHCHQRVWKVGNLREQEAFRGCSIPGRRSKSRDPSPWLYQQQQALSCGGAKPMFRLGLWAEVRAKLSQKKADPLGGALWEGLSFGHSIWKRHQPSNGFHLCSWDFTLPALSVLDVLVSPPSPFLFLWYFALQYRFLSAKCFVSCLQITVLTTFNKGLASFKRDFSARIFFKHA